MPQIEVCGTCKVPVYLSNEHVWLNNGVISAKRDEKQRLVFFECGNLDPLFDGISELIGMSIQHMVVEASRRATKEYMDSVISDDIKDSLRNREIEVRLITDSLFQIWQIMGYGKLTLVDLRYEDDMDDFITARAAKPYCVPLCLGNFAGSIEAMVGREPGIEYREITPGVFEMTIFEAEHPPELKKRLRWRGYDREYKEGDIEYERCPACGCPSIMSRYGWDLDGGTIRSMITGRRMVLVGPSMIDPVFDDLEEEMGASVPRVVVEAQKRFVKSGFFSVEEVIGEEHMRAELALRGMGYLRELKMSRKGVRCRIENSSLHLIGVGLTQGLYEQAFGVESDVEWELREDGDLEIEVSPSGQRP